LQKTNNYNPVKSTASLPRDRPLVSVLIPTYNSSSTIGDCVKSVKAQTYQNIEIIVIDNHSLDETRRIAESYGAETIVIGPERSAQMNHGASYACGKYLLRVDSDMVLDKDLIGKCLKLCEKGAQAIVIPVLPHPSGLNNFWVSCRMLEQKMLLDDMVNVAPRFIDRSIFLAVGGYDETIVAWEDYDLHNRLLRSGCRMSSLQNSALWHLGEASSLGEVVVRMVKYGKTGSLGSFTKKHGLSGLKQISIIRPSFFRHRNYFVTDPLHYIGIFIMKIVQTVSVALGAFMRRL
jgi:glycosyltransferase involved in cell wall biosynthesis